jgi:hypothetical protein
MPMTLLFVWSALAAEPGAALAQLDPSCVCMAIEPGAHADRFTTTWLPITDIKRLEHGEFGGKPLLSAVLATSGRVSIARGDDLERAAGMVAAHVDVPRIDHHTGNACPHLNVTAQEQEAVIVWLQLAEDPHLDAGAFGKSIRAKSGSLRSCLSAGDEAFVALAAKPSGKASAKVVGGTLDDDGASCIEKALKGLKADVSVRAAGTLTFAIETPGA